MSKRIISLSKGMVEAERAFLEQHRQADNLVVDTESGLTVKAEYYAPAYLANEQSRATFEALRGRLREDEGLEA